MYTVLRGGDRQRVFYAIVRELGMATLVCASFLLPLQDDRQSGGSGSAHISFSDQGCIQRIDRTKWYTGGGVG